MNKVKTNESSEFERRAIGLIFLLALALYFSFGIFHLTKFDTADEHFWVDQDRISQYWSAMEKGDFKKTRINNKPGVTLAYVSGIGLFFDKNHDAQIENRGPIFASYDSREFQKIIFFYRFPLLLFNGLFSIFFFWIIAKLTNSKWIGLWSAELILLSPILLGISQIVNPDALSWIFCSATIFSFLLFLKTGLKKFVALAGLLLGLALATKYVALILVYFLFFVLLSWILFFSESEKQGQREFSREVRKLSVAYLAIILGGFLTFSILMPAVFVKSKYLFEDVIDFNHKGFIFWSTLLANGIIFLDAFFWQSRLVLFCKKKLERLKNIFSKTIVAIVFGLCLFVLFNGGLSLNIFNLDLVPFDSRQSDFFMSLPFWKKMILQARPLVFSLTPITLFALFFIWVKILLGKIKEPFLVFALSAFILLYWISVTWQNLLVNVRYGIILTPLAIFLATLGIWEFSQFEKIRKINKLAISLVLIFVSVLSLWLVKPFYFNYANNLLPQKDLITGAWGYGGYEAGQAINSLAKGNAVTVIADYPGVCPFITGQCVDISNDNRKKVLALLSENNADIYYVLTRRGQARWGYIGQFIEAKKEPPLWELNIDNRPGNFIQVYQKK